MPAQSASAEAGASPKAKPAGGSKLADHARGPYAQEIREILAGSKRPA